MLSPVDRIGDVRFRNDFTIDESESVQTEKTDCDAHMT